MTGLAVAALLAGCGSDTAGPEAGVTVAEVQDRAADLEGRTVTLIATVNEAITETAFTIAGEDLVGVEALLVVHDGEFDVQEGSGVSVTGTVRQGFDLRAVEAELGVDYDDVVFDPFDAEPFLRATALDATIY